MYKASCSLAGLSATLPCRLQAFLSCQVLECIFGEVLSQLCVLCVREQRLSCVYGEASAGWATFAQSMFKKSLPIQKQTGVFPNEDEQ